MTVLVSFTRTISSHDSTASNVAALMSDYIRLTRRDPIRRRRHARYPEIVYVTLINAAISLRRRSGTTGGTIAKYQHVVLLFVHSASVPFSQSRYRILHMIVHVIVPVMFGGDLGTAHFVARATNLRTMPVELLRS